MKTKLFFIAMSLLALVGCDIHTPIDVKEPANISFGTFKDTRDGYTYKTITIGDQTWLAENLRYCPNEAIANPYVQSYSEPYYYIFNKGAESDTKKNFEKYGIIYNHNAALSAAPSGWRLPTSGDFEELIETVRSMNGYYKERDLLLMLLSPDDVVNEVEKTCPFLNCTGFGGMRSRYLNSKFDEFGGGTYTGLEYWIVETYSYGIYTYEIDEYGNRINSYHYSTDAFPIRCIKK